MVGEKKDIFDLVAHNLRKNGIREEDTPEYIDKKYGNGQPTFLGEPVPYLTEEELINHKFSIPSERELERIYIRRICETDIEDIDSDKLSEIIIDSYYIHTYKECSKIVKKEFNITYKLAYNIVYNVREKARILTDWRIKKEQGAEDFTLISPYNDKYDGQRFPIDDIHKYMDFIIENKAVPEYEVTLIVGNREYYHNPP